MPRVSDVNNVAPENSPPPISFPAAFDINAKVYEIFGHTKSPFSSSLIFPKVFNFIERNDDETILIALRPHWVTNAPWLLTGIILFICPPFFRYIPLIDILSLNYLFILSFFWYLISAAFCFEKFLSWYFDVYIITNRRVIDIDFYNLLTKKFSETELSKIQDVTSEVSGIGQSVFNYGNVLIQTASEIDEITFSKIPRPDKVVKILQGMVDGGGK